MKGLAPGDESGAALVIALVAVTAIALWTSTALGFADTGFKVTSVLRDQRSTVYGADGAIERAIHAIRYDPAMGRSGDSTCASLAPLTLNGRVFHVRCEPRHRSGAQRSIAVLTLSTAETGVRLASNRKIRVAGDVYSNSSITPEGSGSNSQLNACPPAYPDAQGACTAPKGTVTALGACQVDKIVARVRNCPNGTPDPSGADPDLAPDQTTFGPGAAVPSCAAQVVFAPGRYQDLAALNALTNGSCAGRNFLFTPGVYYFDFDGAWTIGNDRIVVGGVATPEAWAPVRVGDRCRAADATGVQFVFGRSSRMFVNGGQVELCAPSDPESERVAVYGVKTSTGSLTAQNGCMTRAPYNRDDPATCALIRSEGNTSDVLVHGSIYAPLAALDLQITNESHQFVTWGLVSRTLRINNTASTSPSLLPHIGSAGRDRDREALLTACEAASCEAGGAPRLRSLVRFHDYDAAGNPQTGATVTIKSWSVIR